MVDQRETGSDRAGSSFERDVEVSFIGKKRVKEDKCRGKQTHRAGARAAWGR